MWRTDARLVCGSDLPEPATDSHAPFAYDAVAALALSVGAAADEGTCAGAECVGGGDALRPHLAGLDFSGASGRVKFDEMMSRDEEGLIYSAVNVRPADGGGLETRTVRVVDHDEVHTTDSIYWPGGGAMPEDAKAAQLERQREEAEAAARRARAEKAERIKQIAVITSSTAVGGMIVLLLLGMTARWLYKLEKVAKRNHVSARRLVRTAVTTAARVAWRDSIFGKLFSRALAPTAAEKYTPARERWTACVIGAARRRHSSLPSKILGDLIDLSHLGGQRAMPTRLALDALPHLSAAANLWPTPRLLSRFARDLGCEEADAKTTTWGRSSGGGSDASTIDPLAAMALLDELHGEMSHFETLFGSYGTSAAGGGGKTVHEAQWHRFVAAEQGPALATARRPSADDTRKLEDIELSIGAPLSLAEFVHRLLDPQINNAVSVVPLGPSELRAPLAHYYVSTSHNSYLVGDQARARAGGIAARTCHPAPVTLPRSPERPPRSSARRVRPTCTAASCSWASDRSRSTAGMGGTASRWSRTDAQRARRRARLPHIGPVSAAPSARASRRRCASRTWRGRSPRLHLSRPTCPSSSR